MVGGGVKWIILLDGEDPTFDNFTLRNSMFEFSAR